MMKVIQRNNVLKKASLRVEMPFVFGCIYFLLYAQFLCDILRNGILVYEDVHGLIGYECL